MEVSDHFREVTKMMTAGKGAQRAVKDYVLTRSFCSKYLCNYLGSDIDIERGYRD